MDCLSHVWVGVHVCMCMCMHAGACEYLCVCVRVCVRVWNACVSLCVNDKHTDLKWPSEQVNKIMARRLHSSSQTQLMELEVSGLQRLVKPDIPTLKVDANPDKADTSLDRN